MGRTKKIFEDTNIIPDALIMRDPWAEAAQSLLLAVAEEKAEGYITASTMTDLYFLLRKHRFRYAIAYAIPGRIVYPLILFL